MIITKEEHIKVLDTVYDKAKDGIKRVSPPVEEVANKYLKKKLEKQ